MKQVLKSLVLSSAITFGLYQSVYAKESFEFLKESVKRIAFNFETLSPLSDEDCFTNFSTYLPQMGLRGLYCQIYPQMSFLKLKQSFNAQIYLKGPHENALNLRSKTQFGHYNPAFVKQFRTRVLLPFLKDKTFIEKTQLTYDVKLKEMVRSYYRAHQYLESNPDWIAYTHDKSRKKYIPQRMYFKKIKSQYIKHLKNKTLPLMYLQESYRKPTDELIKPLPKHLKDVHWYNINTALAWWTRRSIDGSGHAFYQIFELLIRTYDSDFLKDKGGVHN